MIPPAFLRRLIPDTVVGRTAMVLVAALVVSVGAAVAVFEVQRSEALMALGLRNAAERVAGLAQMVEQAPAESRRSLLHSTETPGFRAGWGVMALVQPSDEGNDPIATDMANHLREHLADHEVRVSTTAGPRPGRSLDGGGGPGAGMGPGMGHGPTGLGRALRLSVGLNDGTWLNVFAPLNPPPPLWRPGFLVPVILSLLIVAAAALWAVKQAARPFASFAAAAERLGLDVAAAPMVEAGPREVRRAVNAFNVMQARIRRFVDDRTQMLAAISHDLRTPITRMKLRAEFVEDEAERAKMLADLDDMERMIAATLVFARDDAANEPRRRIDIAALIQGLVEDLATTGAEVSYQGPDSLVIEARSIALKRAVSNLLGNGIAYGLRVRVALEDAPTEVAIVIDDDGSGIPEGDRERVFSPFVRLEGSRNRSTGGTGLGLSVARAAIRAHGGDIVLANRSEGGLRATAILPKG